MRFRLQWTQKAADHIAPHGVSLEDVAAAVDSAGYVRRTGDRYTVIGTAGSRTLFVVVERSAKDRRLAEVVTARDADASEKRLLRRRGKGSR